MLGTIVAFSLENVWMSLPMRAWTARQTRAEGLVKGVWRTKVDECGAPQVLEVDPKAAAHVVHLR